MSIISLLLLVVVMIGSLSVIYYTFVCRISPMPTSVKIKKTVLDLLKEHSSGTRIYDVGSGWGTLVSAISKATPNATVTGIERSLLPYLFAVLTKQFMKRENSHFLLNDFFNTPLEKADIIVCYLCPELMHRLEEKLENELKDGAIVISNTFALPNWKPIKTVTVDDLYRSTVYLYQK